MIVHQHFTIKCITLFVFYNLIAIIALAFYLFIIYYYESVILYKTNIFDNHLRSMFLLPISANNLNSKNVNIR